jgi:hypothetical protein
MSLPALAVSALIATTASGCGGSSSSTASIGTIDNAADVEALMDAIAVPMAGVFANLANAALVQTEAATVRSGQLASLTASAACPGGGSASYTSGTPGVAAFTGCVLGGVSVSGSVPVSLFAVPPSYSVNIGAGTLTLGGAASGSIAIVNGTIQWTNPATDANTFWEITASIGSATYCVWSGGGACR